MIFGADVPYLDWQHDGCGGNQKLVEDTSALPYGRTELLQRFESACMRHDFNWQNLYRIEHDVDPSLDSWNQTSKDESDNRLLADLLRVCRAAVGNTLFEDVDAFNQANIQCEFRASRITALVQSIAL